MKKFITYLLLLSCMGFVSQVNAETYRMPSLETTNTYVTKFLQHQKNINDMGRKLVSDNNIFVQSERLYYGTSIAYHTGAELLLVIRIHDHLLDSRDKNYVQQYIQEGIRHNIAQAELAIEVINGLMVEIHNPALLSEAEKTRNDIQNFAASLQ